MKSKHQSAITMFRSAKHYTHVFGCFPPFILNLSSVQAFSANSSGPSMTIYRENPDTAKEWIAKSVRKKRFDAYLFRPGDSSWELSNVHGKIIDRSDCHPAFPCRESTAAVPVDRAAFLQEAYQLTCDNGLRLLACRECHANASAADHSNFNVVCLKMICEAGHADLDQIVLIDSRNWPCRVTGVFANVSKLSHDIQDIYLDRMKWLLKSWPLPSDDYFGLLAIRMAYYRQNFVCNLLRHCGRVAGMAEERSTAMVAKWMLASPFPGFGFALHIVEMLHEGMIHHQASAETFSPEIVERRGAVVVKDYEKRLT